MSIHIYGLIVNIQIITNRHKSMHKIQHPSPTSQYSANNSTLLVSLKQKKRELLQNEGQIRERIKQYYSDLTLQIHDKQSSALENFQHRLCEMLENIDNYCAMSEADRYQHRIQILRVIECRADTAGDSRLRDAIRDSSFQVFFFGDGLGLANSSMFQQAKTSKKCNEKQYTIIKEAYLQEIGYLEQKIEKLALKQNKIKIRIAEMQSRQKMKKLGNTYLPSTNYQQKITPNLLIQRLESQNKILIQQIAESSEKILALRSENSMLMKETQLLPTEKKKGNGSESVVGNIIEESVDIGLVHQERINQLQSEIDSMRKEIQNLKITQISREQQALMLSQKLASLQSQLKQLNEYRQRLETECQSHQSRKMQLQAKLDDLNTRYSQLNVNYQNKCKENEGLKQMNSNYGKLIKIKDDKIAQAQLAIMEGDGKLRESDDRFKAMYVEKAQEIQNKENAIKIKQMEVEGLKSMVKRDQSEKSQLKEKLASKEQQIFTISEKNGYLEGELAKANKQKESYAKKQVTKAKKQLKKVHEQQKNAMVEDFKSKYGQFMQKLECIKKDYKDNNERSDRKIKLYENRMEILKEKTAFEMKEMLQKLTKPGQKQKLISVIESYVESQSTLVTKNAQIKMLKEQIAGLKKQPVKKQASKPVTEVDVVNQLQQFEKKLFMQKLELQKEIYEARILEEQQKGFLALQQKQCKIEALNNKCQAHQKTIKEMKSQLSTANSLTNPQIGELKKINDQMNQKEQRMEAQINGLKNNVNRVMGQLQQTRQQLKIKKQLITGLKKQLKDKQLEKNKLNQTVNSLLQQADRLKKTSKEATKKEAIFTEFKDKLINQTELSQQICQLRSNLEQKQKLHKAELTKREQTIREMKVNEEILGKKLKSLSNLEEQIGELKQKVKKMKIEIERKDTLIQHMKDKHQKSTNQLLTTNQSQQNQLKRTRKQLQQQRCKSQSLKLRQGKIQTNCQLLKLSLVRVYEGLASRLPHCLAATAVGKEYNTTTTKADNMHKQSRYQFTTEKSPQADTDKYREALSILEISSEDLQITAGNTTTNIMRVNEQFSSPMVQKFGKKTFNEDIVKLSKLVDSEDVDCKAVVDFFMNLAQC